MPDRTASAASPDILPELVAAALKAGADAAEAVTAERAALAHAQCRIDAQAAQVEVMAGDDAIVLTIRHMLPLSDADKAAWAAFGAEHGFAIFLQPGGIDSVHALWPAAPALSFRLAPWMVRCRACSSVRKEFSSFMRA